MAHAARRAQSGEAAGRLRGRSITDDVHKTRVFNERMELRRDPSARFPPIVAGTLSHGQGHETCHAQMIAEWLGCPRTRSIWRRPTATRSRWLACTYASRSMMIGGSALRAAADEVIERGKRFAAHFMEADAADIAFADGSFTIAGTDRSMPIAQVAQMSFIPVGLALRTRRVGLQGAGAFPSQQPPSFRERRLPHPRAEIHLETGAVELDRYTVVDDCGTGNQPTHRRRARLWADIAQGAGQALLEDIVEVYDHDSGQLLTGTLMDYGIPRADTMPAITIDFSPSPARQTPSAPKVLAKAAPSPALPTVMNNPAILDARSLGRLGSPTWPCPATPERIWAHDL